MMKPGLFFLTIVFPSLLVCCMFVLLSPRCTYASPSPTPPSNSPHIPIVQAICALQNIPFLWLLLIKIWPSSKQHSITFPATRTHPASHPSIHSPPSNQHRLPTGLLDPRYRSSQSIYPEVILQRTQSQLSIIRTKRSRFPSISSHPILHSCLPA